MRLIATIEPGLPRGEIVLLAAWLLFLGLLAAAAGYAVRAPANGGVEPSPGVTVTLRAEPDESAAQPPPQSANLPAEAPDPPAAPAAPSRGPGAEIEAPTMPDDAPGDTAPPDETRQADVAPTPVEAEVPPAWRRYAMAFQEGEGRPRIAVVLTGLGLSTKATEAAIRELPPEVTLSFTPYAPELDRWIALARALGHEVMLDLPMEPENFPVDDPGPQALLTALDGEQNLERLRWVLARGDSYVGVAAVMGSRFVSSESHLHPVFMELKKQGLLFLDNRSTDNSAAGRLSASLEVPLAVNDRSLDRAQTSRVAIDARLVQVERLALTNGSAVAMGRPFPVTIERLRAWLRGLKGRGLVLAPITAVASGPPEGRARPDGTSHEP